MIRLTDRQVEHRQTGKNRVKEAVQWALTIIKTENVQLCMLNGGHIFKSLPLIKNVHFPNDYTII